MTILSFREPWVLEHKSLLRIFTITDARHFPVICSLFFYSCGIGFGGCAFGLSKGISKISDRWFAFRSLNKYLVIAFCYLLFYFPLENQNCISVFILKCYFYNKPNYVFSFSHKVNMWWDREIDVEFYLKKIYNAILEVAVIGI